MRTLSRLLMAVKMRVNSVLDRMEDPRQLVDYAYTQQQELLRKTKQGLIEVATAKVRLEREAQKLRDQAPRMEDQASRALIAGREDLARMALQRKQTVHAELERLEGQVVDLAAEERRLTHTEQQLAARIEEFRVRRPAIVARYSAAKAQVRVSEALSGVSGEFAELSMALGRAVEKTEAMQARAAAIGGLVESGSLALPGQVTDPVERELIKVTVDHTVDDELSELKLRLGENEAPPALDKGPEQLP